MSASRCLGARLEWRLGGIKATIAVPDHERFSGQHTAAEVEPGRVLTFDNGLEREEPFSRAVEFDVTGDEARKVWEFRPEPANWSRAVAADTIVVSEIGARLWPNAAPR